MSLPHVSSSSFNGLVRSDHDLEMQPLGAHVHEDPEFTSNLNENLHQHGTNEAEDDAPHTPTANSEHGGVPTPSSIYDSQASLAGTSVAGSRNSEAGSEAPGGASLYGSDVAGPYHAEAASGQGRLIGADQRPTSSVYNNIEGTVDHGDIPANGRVFNNKNDGTLMTGKNSGVYLSNEAQQGSHEFMGLNTGHATITHSNGTHTIGEHRTNSLRLDSLGEHGRVHINSMNGPAVQTFPQGSVMNYLHPNGITHVGKGGPATFDQYGKQSLTNITGNVLRNPAKSAGGAVGTAATAGLLINNNASLAPTGPAAINAIGNVLKGNG